MVRIYLDDIRTPIDKDWIVVRNYDKFIQAVEVNGLDQIETISLDHDLGPSAMAEYYKNVSRNYKLEYDNIKEKTGYDCAKWLVDHFYSFYNQMEIPGIQKQSKHFPKVYVHSANPIGSANIMGYINNFYMNERREQSCVRVRIEHTNIEN